MRPAVARTGRRLLFLLAALPAAGCYASNVVARTDRLVAAPAELPWVLADADAVPGFWQAAAITGDAALSLRAVYYWFERGGSYTGAALVEGDAGLAFQTLVGRWQVVAGALRLDEGAPARLEAAPDHLRLSLPGGVLVLRRAELR